MLKSLRYTQKMGSYSLILPTLILIGASAISAEYIDLTHDLHNGIPSHPLLVEFNMTVLANGLQPEGYWLQVEKFEAATHIGTHLDAPCHFAEGRWCVNDIPFERFIAPLVVIDISHKAEDNSDALLQPEDLEEWEEAFGKIPDGSVMVMRSGWGVYWPDKENYLGTADKDLSKLHFPGISPSAARWIVNNTNVYGVGVDTVSLDYGQEGEALTHRTLFEANIYGLENLANLDRLPATGAKIYIMPIKIKDGSGAPIRAFAEINTE